jgi:hypothetical protein
MARIVEDHLDIQLKGNFLPFLFSPIYLANIGLIADREVFDSDIEFIYSDLVNYRLSWARISSSTSNLNLTTDNPTRFDALIDLLLAQSRSQSKKPPAISKIRRIRVIRSSHFALDGKNIDLDPLLSLIDPTAFSAGIHIKGLDRLRFVISPGDTGAQNAHISIEPSQRAWLLVRADLVWTSNDGDEGERSQDTAASDRPETLLYHFGEMWPQSLKHLDSRVREASQSLAGRLEGANQRSAEDPH